MATGGGRGDDRNERGTGGGLITTVRHYTEKKISSRAWYGVLREGHRILPESTGERVSTGGTGRDVKDASTGGSMDDAGHRGDQIRDSQRDDKRAAGSREGSGRRWEGRLRERTGVQ